MTAPVESDGYNEMLSRYKDGEISDDEARDFFGPNFEMAAGTVVAMQHIDAADQALAELNGMNFNV